MRYILLTTLLFWSLIPARGQVISTIAGNGTAATLGNGGQATLASLNEPSGVYRTLNGNIYVVEYGGNVVRKIDTAGIISTFAGNGSAGYTGDHGPATAASFHIPIDITFDNKGNAYIVDNVNCAIRKVDTNGIITTFAGIGTPGYSGDNGPATAATLYWPDRVGHDRWGNVYIADAQNNVIRKVDTNGVITTCAGNGTAGFSGDNGPATAAMLNWTLGIAFDANDNMYIADGSNHRVRMVDPSGIITTFAGNGTNAIAGDSGPATAASFMLPGGVAVDGGCNVYVSDFYGNNLRKIFTTGVITTVVNASDIGGFSGDGSISTLAEINGPDNITFDTSYSIFLADFYNNRVRKVNKIGANTGCHVVAVNEISDLHAQISVVPNPAHEEVRIGFMDGDAAPATLHIFNVLGQTVFDGQIDGTSGIGISVSGFPRGVYIARLTTATGKTGITKFVIE